MPIFRPPDGAGTPRFSEKGDGNMALEGRGTAPSGESAVEEILRAVHSEPALSWFLAQAIWIAQPALEAFWPQEKLSAVAEFLESADPGSAGGSAVPAEEGGGKKT
jgi:hypothetical protein